MAQPRTLHIPSQEQQLVSSLSCSSSKTAVVTRKKRGSTRRVATGASSSPRQQQQEQHNQRHKGILREAKDSSSAESSSSSSSSSISPNWPLCGTMLIRDEITTRSSSSLSPPLLVAEEEDLSGRRSGCSRITAATTSTTSPCTSTSSTTTSTMNTTSTNSTSTTKKQNEAKPATSVRSNKTSRSASSTTTVHFKSKIQIRRVIPADKLTDQPESLWYQPDELQAMYLKIAKIVDKVRAEGQIIEVAARGGGGGGENDNNNRKKKKKKAICIRGLERMITPDVAKQKRVQAVGTVLDLQASLLLLEPNGDVENNDLENVMAEQYKTVTRDCLSEAIEFGRADAEAANVCY